MFVPPEENILDLFKIGTEITRELITEFGGLGCR
jgi:hypothetical protein